MVCTMVFQNGKNKFLKRFLLFTKTRSLQCFFKKSYVNGNYCLCCQIRVIAILELLKTLQIHEHEELRIHLRTESPRSEIVGVSTRKQSRHI